MLPPTERFCVQTVDGLHIFMSISHRFQLTFIYTYVPSSFSIQCYFATELLFILQDSVVQVYFLRTSLTSSSIIRKDV